MGLKLHCSDAFFSKARLRPEQVDRALPLPGVQVWRGREWGAGGLRLPYKVPRTLTNTPDSVEADSPRSGRRLTWRFWWVHAGSYTPSVWLGARSPPGRTVTHDGGLVLMSP